MKKTKVSRECFCLLTNKYGGKERLNQSFYTAAAMIYLKLSYAELFFFFLCFCLRNKNFQVKIFHFRQLLLRERFVQLVGTSEFCIKLCSGANIGLEIQCFFLKFIEQKFQFFIQFMADQKIFNQIKWIFCLQLPTLVTTFWFFFNVITEKAVKKGWELLAFSQIPTQKMKEFAETTHFLIFWRFKSATRVPTLKLLLYF